MSHSYSTVKSYKLAIINQNNCGFRYFLQQRYKIDEFEFVNQTKQEKFDVYPILRDFVIFLDKLQYKPQTIKSRLAAIKGYLRFLGLKIYTEDCKQIIKIPKDIKELKTIFVSGTADSGISIFPASYPIPKSWNTNFKIYC